MQCACIEDQLNYFQAYISPHKTYAKWAIAAIYSAIMKGTLMEYLTQTLTTEFEELMIRYPDQVEAAIIQSGAPPLTPR